MSQKKYILVVDDHAGIRRLLYEMLSEDGYSVEMAINGSDAIQKVKNRFPSLILLDAKMPGMSGFETFVEINKINQLIPIIIITAYPELKQLKKAKESSKIRYYAEKPFEIEKLREMVKVILHCNNVSELKQLTI